MVMPHEWDELVPVDGHGGAELEAAPPEPPEVDLVARIDDVGQDWVLGVQGFDPGAALADELPLGHFHEPLGSEEPDVCRLRVVLSGDGAEHADRLTCGSHDGEARVGGDEAFGQRPER
jgi:hypothetical protein